MTNDTVAVSTAALLRDVAQVLENEWYEEHAREPLREYLRARPERLRALADAIDEIAREGIAGLWDVARLLEADRNAAWHFVEYTRSIAAKLEAILPPSPHSSP